MRCRLFGHKLMGWQKPRKHIGIEWWRACLRCGITQNAGYGKKPNYKNIKEYK